MTPPLSILLVAHGFPPRETAGTERHTAALAAELTARGHRVHVLAATRSPGRPQYEVVESDGVTRVVNNIATRALSDGESDPIIDAIAATVEARFQPDIVHVHHTQFLSSTMRFDAPTVVTLHDQWAWCASGGLGLKPEGDLCDGPSPSDCSSCHSQWRPGPSASARAMTRAAAAVSAWVDPDRLHRLYKRIPARLRPSPVRGEGLREPPRAAAHRNRMTLDWFQGAQALISPSEHLANLAAANGLHSIQLIRHGLADEWFVPRRTVPDRAPFVHIGTIAHHKGTDLVVRAHQSLSDPPSLRLFGPVLDPEAALGHPVGAALTPSEVRTHLAAARALVLGARWAENAPLIIIEARAVGCPVIAPRIGGIPELIEHGVDGLLVEPDSHEALAEAMTRVVNSPPMIPSRPPPFSAQVDRIESVYQRVHHRPAV